MRWQDATCVLERGAVVRYVKGMGWIEGMGWIMLWNVQLLAKSLWKLRFLNLSSLWMFCSFCSRLVSAALQASLVSVSAACVPSDKHME